MPRPQKCRRVSSEPQFSRFSPCGVEQPEENVLSVDEYEVIRWLIMRKKQRTMRRGDECFTNHSYRYLR